MPMFKKMLAFAQPWSPPWPVFILWRSHWNSAVYCRLQIWLLCLLLPWAAWSRQMCLLFADVHQRLNSICMHAFLPKLCWALGACRPALLGNMLFAAWLLQERSGRAVPRVWNTVPLVFYVYIVLRCQAGENAEPWWQVERTTEHSFLQVSVPGDSTGDLIIFFLWNCSICSYCQLVFLNFSYWMSF